MPFLIPSRLAPSTYEQTPTVTNIPKINEQQHIGSDIRHNHKSIILDNPPPYSESYHPPLPPPHFYHMPSQPVAAASSQNGSPTAPEAADDADPHPHPLTFITQVPNHSVVAVRPAAEVSTSRREEDDVYCIYNMRGVRRDLKRREAKLIPEPFALHFKNGYMHISWDQMTNWPWIPAHEVVGEDWEYRAVPVPDVPLPLFPFST
jgi:hypothetical protein